MFQEKNLFIKEVESFYWSYCFGCSDYSLEYFCDESKYQL